MHTITISDITMKQAAQSAELSLSFKEKLEIPKLLDKLGADVIELEGITQPKVDALRIKSTAMSVRNSIVAVPVTLDLQNVQEVWAAVSAAQRPRLQVPAPVSAIQMEYLCHKKPDALLAAVAEMVAACRTYTEEVEFLAQDATRSDPEFLAKAVTAAMDAGAKIVTVCDTAGAMLPDEFDAFLDDLFARVPRLKDVKVGVQCANALGMADACVVSAVRHGVTEIKAAAYPIDTASLSAVARIFAAKSDALCISCGVRTTELGRITDQIAWLCQTDRSKSSPFDNGVQEEDNVLLTAGDDMQTVERAVVKLGYDLSEEDVQRVYEEFLRIAKQKNGVGTKELDAIVASAAMQVPPTYRLESYVINSGNVITATAHIKLRKGDEVLEGISIGDGSVDAVFLAIEQTLGHHYELDDFQIQAVTEGREAMGQTIVKLRSNGRVCSGRGISTDILGASVMAYINALNKIVYEEEQA